MPSLRFPDTGSRYIFTPSGKPAANGKAYVYQDVAHTVPAEIYRDVNGTKGALVPLDEDGRVFIRLDNNGGQVDYWGPASGQDRLFLVIGGVPSVSDADYNARIDTVETAIAALAPTTGLTAEVAARIAGDAATVVTAADDATSKADNAQAAAISAATTDATDKVAAHSADTTGVHGIADTSVLETVSGAQDKATTAQAAAVASSAQKSANLSDLGSASTARTNLGLGTSATRNVGTTSGDVAAGDAPAAAQSAAISAAATDATAKVATETTARTAADALLTPQTRTITAGTGLTGGGTLAADRTLTVAYGTTSTTAARGDDARLSDARTPITHATSHASGGSDPITVAQSQVTGLTAALGAKADLVGGLVPTSQIPPSSATYRGETASQAAMLALPAVKGDYTRRTDTEPNTFWTLIGTDPTVLGNWLQTSSAGAVSSVNSQSGNVVLGPTDVGAVPTGRTVATTSPLTGGGALSGNLTLGVTTGTTAGTVAAGDAPAAAQAAAISAAASDATTKASAAQAAAVQRTNHTGTQSADTVVDGSTNKAYSATEKTKLAGIATGATSNSTDAQLRDRTTHTGTQSISTIAALQAALDSKVGVVDYWINVQKQAGIAYNGSTDDSVAFQAVLDAIPAAFGNEVGGVGLYFPHGVMLLNTPTGGVLATLANKPNVLFRGTGAGSRIRTSSATATELLRVETCTIFNMQDLMIQVIGTAKITRALHYTTASPGSAHFGRFSNVTISCNGSYRIAGDVSCTTGSPTIYSALAQFASGDVGGFIMVDLSTGPFTSTIQSVATLTGTLAASINSSVTTITLNAPITGAPASGFTIKVGNERMFVSAGGNTTSLTVARGRGPDVLSEAHTAGDTVTTYRATLADNATLTVSNSVAPARIQPAGGALMENGFCIGVDSPGASNLDVANTNVEGLVVLRAAVAGVRSGNGTSGNNLDHWSKGTTISESGYAVYLNAGSFSIRGGDFDNNVIEIRRIGVSAAPVVFDDIRSESSYGFYSMTGSATSGPPTRLSDIKISTCNAEDGVPFRHVNSGSLTMKDVEVTGSPTVRGNLLAVVSGTAASPCHFIADNVGHSGATGDLFASVGVGVPGVRTAIKNVRNQYRLAPNGVIEENTVVANYTGGHQVFAGGFARTRTTVADANYTVLRTDMKVVYTSLTVARVVTLPAQGNTLPAGQEFIIKDESGSCDGTKTITITPPAGTIDGAASLVLNTAYAKASVYTNGTNWFTQ